MAFVALASVGITEVPSIISDISIAGGETVPSPPNPVTPSIYWCIDAAISWGEIYWSPDYGVGDVYDMNIDETGHWWRVRTMLLIMGILVVPEMYIIYKNRKI